MPQLSEQVSYILKVYKACLGFLINITILFRKLQTTGHYLGARATAYHKEILKCLAYFLKKLLEVLIDLM